VYTAWKKRYDCDEAACKHSIRTKDLERRTHMVRSEHNPGDEERDGEEHIIQEVKIGIPLVQIELFLRWEMKEDE
jgi:hypothetical protein